MPETIQTKRCSKCKQTFPATLEYFYKSKECKYGLRPDCKQCYDQRHKQYYEVHKTERQKSSIQYYHSNKRQRKRYRNQYHKTIKGYLRHLFSYMLSRCNNPKCGNYKYYGGRGIRVKFISFTDFYDYVVNELQIDPRGLTIDRINNNGHYERGNIRFVTQAENNLNKRKRA